MCDFDFELEQLFMRRFRAGIFFLEPSSTLVMEYRGRVYGFPEGTTAKEVNTLMEQSLHAERNLILDRIKTNEILTDPEVYY